MPAKNKTALVLAGGGLSGAVYEIGALRAIDDLLIDLTVNDFDIYVGTSAGALVNAFLANGVSPEEMFSVMDGTNQDVNGIERQNIFHINFNDYLGWGFRLPVKLMRSWSNYLSHVNSMTFFDFIWSLGVALPAGLYDGLGIEAYIREALEKLELPNTFNQLSKELYIIATDLDCGERAIFGPGHLEAPISMAVAASSALPILYQPIKIGSHEYIDGGFRGTASLDLAIERGARLVVCINPMVPFDSSQADDLNIHDTDEKHISKGGIQSITGQSLRIFSYAGLHYHVKQVRRAHPQVDIILVEPQQNDYQMTFDNIMRYSTRLRIAQHGFETVTYDLAKEYALYKQVLTRHGVRVSRRLLIQELNEIAQSGHDPDVIRKILEANQVGCRQRHPHTPTCQLSRTLNDLESILSYPTGRKK